MLLDFVSKRNKKNVFGDDLWGKAINNVGIYHRLLNVEGLYDNEKQEAISNLMNSGMTLEQAEQTWRESQGIYNVKEPSIFTSRREAKTYREGLFRPAQFEDDGKTHKYVTREEYGQPDSHYDEVDDEVDLKRLIKLLGKKKNDSDDSDNDSNDSNSSHNSFRYSPSPLPSDSDDDSDDDSKKKEKAQQLLAEAMKKAKQNKLADDPLAVVFGDMANIIHTDSINISSNDNQTSTDISIVNTNTTNAKENNNDTSTDISNVNTNTSTTNVNNDTTTSTSISNTNTTNTNTTNTNTTTSTSISNTNTTHFDETGTKHERKENDVASRITGNTRDKEAERLLNKLKKGDTTTRDERRKILQFYLNDTTYPNS